MMEAIVMYVEAVIAEHSATEEQLDVALEAQALFNVTYCVDRHLAAVVPDLSEEDRHKCAEEIAITCNGEGVAEACRRYANDLMRTSLLAEHNASKLGERFKRNDTGNGERFAEDHGENFKYLEDRGVWMKWDGKRWRDAKKTELTRAAKLTAKKMLAEAIKSENKDDHAHALATLQRKGLSGMIELAQSEKIFSADMKQFDIHPDLLTVENGTIDLRTGVLYPHMREDMITTLTNIKYDLTATCPRWDQFLLEIFNNDQDLIEFVQRGVGYSMTGYTREHAFFILWGTGRNGKGRFIKQLNNLLGDAARTTRFQTFTASRDQEGGNTPALAALAGSRLVSAGEPDEGVRLSESVIKMLTGEDEINVCRKHEHPFSYMPLYKIWLHCNHKPAIRGTDEGIWSRPRLIPFGVTFKTADEVGSSDALILKNPDRKLDAKLNAERSGILAWAVRGARQWFVNGLGHSKTVDEATKAYQTESDRLGPFVEECIKSSPGSFVINDKLCAAYSAWCRRNLVDYEMNGQTLSKQMAARGYIRGKNEKGLRGFKDIVVTEPGVMVQAVVPTGLASERASERVS